MLDTVHSLSSLPATDGNFISVLNRSTDEEISQAIDVMENSSGKHKGRITACKRELNGGNLVKKIYQDGRVRKLLPLEYERLQTLPDYYTDCVSDSRRYTAIGNGWTVDVISHIFRGLKR